MPIDLENIKTYIEKNIARIHTIEDIATPHKVSPETLKKEFLRREGIGISDFVAKTRVLKMKDLLVRTNDKCLVICLRIGCREDVGGRLFKRITGMTMEEFRRRHRDGLTEVDAKTK
jgi:transcriptional regulator GlxA family with amidase domain